MTTPELVLGTVQFGQPYGVARPAAPPAEDEVRAMLERAFEAGVRMLDTAPVYGGAEAMLGRLGAARRFGLITKVPAGMDTPNDGTPAAVECALRGSLGRLRSPSIDVLLFHDADDLLRPGGERLWDGAMGAQARGLARHVGVSVYEPGQLRAVLERYPVEHVQLPFNVYDGRFADTGLLDRLHELGIVVHARSVFLQGALLQSPAALPAWLDGLRGTQAELHRWGREQGTDPIGVALATACAHPGIEGLVIGCRSLEELEGVLSGYETARRRPELGREASARFRLHDEALLDPRCWPQ